MRKIFFLVALLSASIMSFADEAINSEYCGEVMSSGNTQAAFTWETNDEGSVLITISETLGGDLSATHFRGNGINIDKITVGDSREPAATYFNLACGGSSTITLSLKDPNNAPASGTKIYVTDKIIEYATSKDGNAWPTLSFEYTYGGKCMMTPEVTTLSLTSPASFAQIGQPLALTVIALDQLNRPMDAAISLSVEPASAGTLEGNVYTPTSAAAATITATCGDVSKSIIVYGVPSDNLALNKTVVAGYEPGNPDELSSKANDGNTNTQWVTYADQPASVEWWYVDLGAKYLIAAIDVLWGDPTSTSYILQVRDDAPSDEEATDDNAWTTIASQSGITINSEQFISFTGATLGRYVRLHSLSKSANFFRLKEVRVFGTEWTHGDDNVAPEMVSAKVDELKSASVVLAVSATDNNELIANYHVVETANGINLNLVPSDGKIVIENLTPSTSYSFVVTAVDANHNESANSITVPVTTPARALVPAAAAPTPTWPAAQVKSLYSDAYAFAPASLNSYNEGWWNNPNMTEEIVAGDHYLHYDLYRNGMIGVQFAETSVALMEKLHIDVYASKAGTITFRFITAGDPDAVNNTKKTLTLEAEKWNSFDIDLSEFGAHNWQKLFQFAIENYEAGGLVGEHISVDNIYLYRTTGIEDTEAPTNLAGSVTAFSYFTVTLALSAQDNLGVVNYTVKNGDEVLATAAGASGATVNVIVPGLLPNTDYNLTVTVKDENGNEAAPINIPAKTAEAPAPAAPAPDSTNKETVTVFCDALEGQPGINIGGWGQSTVVTNGQLAEGDNVQYCTNMNYLGWELNPAVDATGMEYLHVDLYTTTLTSVKITPISPGHEGVYSINLTRGVWNQVEIPLSTYSTNGIEWNNIFQMKFFDAAPAGGDLFIDNVYFYKEVKTGMENIQPSEVGIQKVLRNGMLYIERNGKLYNVTGASVR